MGSFNEQCSKTFTFKHVSLCRVHNDIGSLRGSDPGYDHRYQMISDVCYFST